MSETTRTPKLQLTVVDFGGGDVCVRVDEGILQPCTVMHDQLDTWTKGHVERLPMTLASLSHALRNNTRPLPRMEWEHTGMLKLYRSDGEAFRISEADWRSLSRIGGDEIPVYCSAADDGIWVRFPLTSESMGDPLAGTGIAIWRYIS